MFKESDFTQEEYQILTTIQQNQDLFQKILQALEGANSNFDASIIVKELFNSYFPEAPEANVDWESVSMHIKEYQMHVSSIQVHSIPIEPDRYIETPKWQPQEEPLTIPETFPEEAPVEPEREPERVPEKVSELPVMPCMIPIEPDRYIETPKWQPQEEPLTIPETFPEEAPVEPEREPERVPEKVGSHEEFQRVHHNPIGYKILFVDEDGTLVSPSQKTRWPVGEPLIEPRFNIDDWIDPVTKKFKHETGGVRNQIGIHIVFEGHWQELYSYLHDHRSVLIKGQIYNDVAPESESKGLCGGLLPIEVIGTDKDILFKVKQKYAIDTHLVGEEGRSSENITYNGQDFYVVTPGDPEGTYKGFDFAKNRESDREENFTFKSNYDNEPFATLTVRGRREVTALDDFGNDNIPFHKSHYAIEDFVKNYLDGAQYSKEYTYDHYDDIESIPENSNYRDTEKINNWEELLRIWQNIKHNEEYYTEWVYEESDGQDNFRLSGQTDGYGIEYYEEVQYYHAPDQIDLSSAAWVKIFEDIVDYLISSDSFSPDDTSIAKALIEVPWFIETNGGNQYGHDEKGDPFQSWDGDIQSLREWAVGWAQDRIDHAKKTGNSTQAAEQFMAAFSGQSSIPDVNEQQGQLFQQIPNKDYWTYDDPGKPQRVQEPGYINHEEFYPNAMPQIKEDDNLGMALGAIKEADYFYDWQGYYPDDGSLNDGVAQNGSPSPSFFNMPDRCPGCDHPSPAGHLINFDEADKKEGPTSKCENCGYAYPMEYDNLSPSETGVGQRWNVLNKVSYGPHAPKTFTQKAPIVNGPTGEQYFQLQRGMSDREYKRWMHGEVITAGKYFTTSPHTFNVHSALVKQTDEHTFTLQQNALLGANDFIDAAGMNFNQIAPSPQMLKGTKFESQFYPPEVAQRIAATNLKEFPNYYDKVASDEDKFSEIDLLNVPNGPKPTRDTTMPNKLAPSFIEINKKQRPNPKVTIVEPSIVSIPAELYDENN